MKKSSFLRNTWKDIKHSQLVKIGWLISGVVGSLVAWFMTANDKSTINRDNVILIVVIVLCWYLFIIGFILMKNLAKYIHNTFVDSLYGKVITSLTQLNLQMKDLVRGENVDDDNLMKVLKTICNELKQFFDNKTSAKCGVSIKVTLSKDKEITSWKFRNLCRDDKNTCRDTAEYLRAEHTVVGNTPYQHVVNQLIRHSTKVAYINNNIPEAKDYLNTSKINEETILPYKSELVYPIMPLKRGEVDSVMCGFLCVDCDKIEKFDEKRYDVPVIESIIDNLYELLVRVIDTRKNEN